MRSIRTQLLSTLLPGVLLLSAVSGVGLYAFVEESLEHSLDLALTAKADAIAAAVRIEDDGQPVLHLADIQSSPGGLRRDGPFFFQLWRADGRTLARSGPGTGPLPGPPQSHRPFADATLDDGTTVRVTRVTVIPKPDEDEHGPADRPAPTERLTLVVAHDRRAEDRPLAVLLAGLSVTAAVMAVGIVVIVTWGVRRGLRPVGAVSGLADRIGPESLDVRFPGAGQLPSELLPIGLKLNDLLDRLAAGFARERRFSAAVAHELRTPVAELRALCEVAVRWPDEGRATSDAVVDALAIAREMGTAVDNVLLLARCQAGAERLHPEAVDLAAELDRAWSPHRALAADRRLAVEWQVESSCPVWVDPRALAVVLRNLLENAVEHATAGGRLRVHTEPGADRVTLTIGNASSGLSAADLPHLTEAFWRKDAARTGRTHAGLGLAIVDGYGRLAGIDFHVRMDADDWFEAVVSLPVGPS